MTELSHTPDGFARLPSRAEIREAAERHLAELRVALKEGKNVAQANLDHGDKVEAYASLLRPADAETFVRIYSEEIAALSSQVAIEKQAESARKVSTNYAAYVLSSIVVVMLLYFVLSMVS